MLPVLVSREIDVWLAESRVTIGTERFSLVVFRVERRLRNKRMAADHVVAACCAADLRPAVDNALDQRLPVSRQK